ncbi:MAG: hypothetical protein ACT4QC_18280 [Planctomycetaceae bacterium]
MGFTPSFFTDSDEEIDRTLTKVYKYSDMIAFHMDYGVPWPEALENKPFPEGLAREIKLVKARQKPSQKTYLALNPLNLGRNNLAKYWGAQRGMPLPDAWNNKDLDDPGVIRAYGDYVLRMIDEFEPDYLAYAVESNMLALINPTRFEKFLVLVQAVYPKLKARHPDLPVFVTIQLDVFQKAKKPQIETVKQLLPFTDFLAISTYPYMNGHTPKTLPRGWFQEFVDIAPEKPFAVAETTFPAEHYEPQFDQPRAIAADAKMQREYVEWLLEECNRLEARFAAWFFIEDLDDYYARVKTPQERVFLMMWRDTGLFDGSGNARESLGVWERWLARPVAQSRP